MDHTQLLRDSLFNTDDGLLAYAIVDGAACPELLPQLDELAPEYFCLFSGELEPDVEERAPHLVTLEPDHPFTNWLLAELPGKPWGIFIKTAATLRQLRKHFRSFLVVKNEAGENLYFRYYDPRVLRVFLPTCDPEQFKNFFGPVSIYIAESDTGTFTAHTYTDGKLQSRRLTMADSGERAY